MNENIETLEKIIIKTTIYIKKYLLNNIITTTLYNNSIEKLENLYNNIKNDNINTTKEELYKIIEKCGTEHLKDVFYISSFKYDKKQKNIHKLKLLNDYFHPINFKIYNNKNNKKERLSKLNIVDNDKILKLSKNWECFNLGRTSKNYFIQVYGVKLIIYNKHKTIIIDGIIDDTLNTYYKNNLFIKNNFNKFKKLNNTETFNNFIKILTLKDYIIYSPNEINNIFNKYTYLNTNIKNNTIENNVISFINHTLYNKRNILIALLIDTEYNDSHYLAYLLYDLLSNDKEHFDNNEQIYIFNSLPWNIKKLFYKAMKNTLEYTKKLTLFNEINISEEQQICLLKTTDFVKKKAMDKLNEIKSKSEDSASKPKKYLNGLLQIPFQIFKKEPILELNNNINIVFSNIIKIIKNNDINIDIIKKKNIIHLKLKNVYF